MTSGLRDVWSCAIRFERYPIETRGMQSLTHALGVMNPTTQAGCFSRVSVDGSSNPVRVHFSA